MGRPKKVKPLVKVGVERAKDVHMCDLFDMQCGPSRERTKEERQQLWATWTRIQDEFLPRPDRLAGPTFKDPWRERPGNRPYIWWAGRGLKMPDRDGEKLLALKKLGALVQGEWEAALANLRDRALNSWINVEARKGKEQETADQLGVPVAWIRK